MCCENESQNAEIRRMSLVTMFSQACVSLIFVYPGYIVECMVSRACMTPYLQPKALAEFGKSGNLQRLCRIQYRSDRSQVAVFLTGAEAGAD
jgi:hypothetical protein